MNARWLAALALVSSVVSVRSQPSSPRLLGVAGPAELAGPAPELAQLRAISDDGRWLLFTTASDRIGTHDFNACVDAFLYDRVRGAAVLVSASPAGQSGEGTSLAQGLDALGSRVAFQSRAADLAGNDNNLTWDVYVRDVTGATNILVSVAASGLSGAGASTKPQITPSGRFVLFESEATDLAALSGPVVHALYRRELESGTTVWFSQDLAGLGTVPTRTGDARMTADGRFVAFIASGQTQDLFLRDLTLAKTTRLTAPPPPGTTAGPALSYARPVLSDDGIRFACRCTFGRTNGVVYFDRRSATTAWLGRGTNAFPGAVSTERLGPEISSDGRFVAFAQPVLPPGTVNPVVQVFVWDAESQTTTLVSSRQGTTEFANGHAFEPRLTPDGRHVAFLSGATDLVPGVTSPALRVYWFDRDVGTVRVAAELGTESAAADLVLSPNGMWLAALATSATGALTIPVFEAATGLADVAIIAPWLIDSSTARGWIGVRPEGVSADGRYVAMLAFPSNAPPAAAYAQVEVLDTQTGARVLVTRAADGTIGNGNAATPSLSADGARVAFASAASNLTAADANGLRDVFVSPATASEPALIRSAPVPVAARHAGPDPLISPDGRYLLLTFDDTGKQLSRLADLQTSTISRALPGPLFGSPVFSRDGTRAVASIGLSSGSQGTVHAIDVPQWVNSGSSSALLWSAGTATWDPVLSQDGRRVAFWRGGSTLVELLVVDWQASQTLWLRDLNRKPPSSLGLSADGCYLVWVSATGASPGVGQVWRADLDRQTVALVSVAADGIGEGNGNSRHAAVSSNGRYVAFASLADNLVPDDDNHAKDVFLRDMQAGRTLLVSRTPSGQPGNGWSTQPFFSADGNCLYFLSYAADLASGDANQAPDLFKVEIVDAAGDLLVVLRRNVTTGQAHLLWNGRPGKQYRVDYTDSVDAPRWQSLPGPFASDAVVEVPPNLAARRFFRLAELP